MRTIIINIGDELLIGQVVNTNASWMAAYLNENGMRVIEVKTIADDGDAIRKSVEEAMKEGDVVLLTGGLGPTKDDITKHTLCEMFHSELVLHEPSLKNVEEIFAKRGYLMSDTNRAQAMVPACCEVLINRTGTAPGMWLESDGKVVISMPGVPHEMRYLMREEVVPRLKERWAIEEIYHKNVWTFGIGESFLSDSIEEWELALPKHIHLAYLPKDGMVRLRLSAYGNDRNMLVKEVAEEVRKLRELVGEYIFGEDEDTLEGVVGRMLRERGLTLSTVESCTGGNVARMLTSVAGASGYFKGGVVSYVNEIKERIVGVERETLEKWTAVSEETVKEMATGVRERFDTDYALATTGYAGPTGGTEEAPVGTVWIGIAWREGVEAVKFTYGDDRERTIMRASNQALRLLQQKLCER